MFDYTQEVRQELAETIAKLKFHRYPDPSSDLLRIQLSVQLGVDKEQIVIVAGSDELIGNFMLGIFISYPNNPTRNNAQTFLNLLTHYVLRSRFTQMIPKISGIILAAGLSTRMGEPKQLLPFGGSTIIETVIDNLFGSKLAEVIVVVGHEADKIKAHIQHKPIKIAFNPDYQVGMLTSAQCGVRSISESADAFALTLVDLPLITSDLIDLVIDAYTQTTAGIVVPSYNYRRGHPVVFNRQYVADILALDEKSRGIRSLFRRYTDHIQYVTVDTDRVLRDIDYREDYEQALQESTH